MKKISVNRRAPAGDRVVAIGGFILVLLTGFFGAEPADVAPNERVVIATSACSNDATTNCAAR